jgi:hypothetical protein
MDDVESPTTDVRFEAPPNLSFERKIARICKRDVGGPAHARSSAEKCRELVHWRRNVFIVHVFDGSGSNAYLFDVLAIPDVSGDHNLCSFRQCLRSLVAHDRQRWPLRVAVIGKQ